MYNINTPCLSFVALFLKSIKTFIKQAISEADAAKFYIPVKLNHCTFSENLIEFRYIHHLSSTAQIRLCLLILMAVFKCISGISPDICGMTCTTSSKLQVLQTVKCRWQADRIEFILSYSTVSMGKA